MQTGSMPTGSIVIRRSLGRRLKALRLGAGRTAADVVVAGIASKAKLHRIEGGQGAIRVADVRSLCWLYGVDQATTDALADLALNTAREGWWEEYGDIMPPWFATYVELEAAASRILVYEPELVVGLLQTPDYTRALCEVDPHMTAGVSERLVQLRAQRQKAALGRENPVELNVIMSPGVLLRQVGGPQVLDQQIDHLGRAARESHVDVRVLPWSSGAHVAMQGAFAVLQFAEEDHPDVVYLETRAGAYYVTKEGQVADYVEAFAAIQQQSQAFEEHWQ